MPPKPDQAVIETAFQDPAELAAQAAAVRAAARDDDKTEELRPLGVVLGVRPKE